MPHDAKSTLSEHRGWLKQVAKQHIRQELNRKLDASDVVQETLLRVHRSAPEIRGKSEAEVRAYLLTAMANCLIDAHRGLYAGKRNIALERSIKESLNQSSESILRWIESREMLPHQCLTVKESRERVLEALDKLALASDIEYQVVVRVKFDGEKQKELAASLNVTPSTVAKHLRHGLKKMKEYLTSGD